MATLTSTNEAHYWKIIKILINVGQPVMYKVFRLGTKNKPINQNLITYLDNIHPPCKLVNYIGATRRERSFDGTQRQKIISNTSGNEFDITLLFLVIKLACEDVKDLSDLAWSSAGLELENCVYVIKKKRNEAMHEVLVMTTVEFMNKVRELRELFINTLNAAQQRYSRDFTLADLAVEERHIHNALHEISIEVISMHDLQTYCSPMLLYDLEMECRCELNQKFSNMHNINPVSFILGGDLKMDVSVIFTDVEIEHPDRRATRIVSYQDFFVEVQRSLGAGHSGVTVVLMEGLAGSGKTTLVRLMVKQWCDGLGSINDLDAYQVVLHVACRDLSTNTYSKLLEESLPQTYTKFRSLLEPLMAQCRVLMLVDGYDEASRETRKLLSDMLNKLQAANVTIICTSRPERSSDFQYLVSSLHLKVTLTRIKGIPQDKRGEFIEKNHRIMAQQTGSGQDTDALVHQLEELVKNEHYRLALNLILATWVCDQEPRVLRVNTTQTELYMHTLRLSWMKLRKRLSTHPETDRMEEWQRKAKVEEWQPHMYKEQFQALSQEKIVLPHKAVARLRSACVTLQLPAAEMLGACLSLKCIPPDVEQYAAPHKGLQDFFGALYVLQELENQPGTPSIRTALECPRDWTHIIKFQNLLQHMAGLLHLQPDPLPDLPIVAKEVVDLLSESGVKNREQWLDVIVETNASPDVLAAIASHFNTGITTIIDIGDGRVETYTQLLPHLPQAVVRVNITSIPTPQLECALVNHIIEVNEQSSLILTHLQLSRVSAIFFREVNSHNPLVPHLVRHKYKSVVLWHDYWYPNATTPATHNILHNTLPGDQALEAFTGQISASVGERLQQHSHTLVYLFLGVASDDQAAILMDIIPTLTNLQYLRIRVTPAVSPGVLAPLPDEPDAPDAGAIVDDDDDFIHVREVELDLTKVNHGRVDWAVSVCGALQPKSGYKFLRFPQTTMEEDGWRSIIQGLHRRGVKVEQIKVPWDTISDSQFHLLEELTIATLEGEFLREKNLTSGGWERLDDDDDDDDD